MALFVGVCSLALLHTRPLAPAPAVLARHRALTMELRVPEDDSTVSALIQRTKDNLKEGLIVVLHFNDPTAAPNSWDYTCEPSCQTVRWLAHASHQLRTASSNNPVAAQTAPRHSPPPRASSKSPTPTRAPSGTVVAR